MKKLAVITVLALAALIGYKKRHSFLPREGAFDKDGNPVVWVFVSSGCGPPCAEVAALMTERNVHYEPVDFETEGPSRGARGYPTTMVGARRVEGNRMDEIVALLAETYGPTVLTRSEQRALAGHFDAAGKPLVVLYGTQWCGYCTRQREFFASEGIPFVDVDVETSPEGRSAFEALRGTGYPLIYVGYRRLGYDQAAIKAAIAELM